MTPVSANHTSPEDQQLREAFDSLAPPAARVAHLEDRILEDFATDHKSLAGEWLELFHISPVLHASYAVAAAAGLAVVTPVGTLLLTALLL